MAQQSKPTLEMLERVLDAIDISALTFDRDRKTIYANKKARQALHIKQPRHAIGAAEENHFTNHHYYDENGERRDFSRSSLIDLAFKGVETHDLVLEHRNVKEHTNRWLSISCVPSLDEKGNFEYGILWYRDITRQKSQEHRLQFLVRTAKILSITAAFEERLREKARITVPTLADWCSIELLAKDGSLRRIALVHRDPKMIEQVYEYEKKYPPKPGTETNIERVIHSKKVEFIPLITDELIDTIPVFTPEQRSAIKALKLSSSITLPIIASGKVLGALSVAFAESGRVYTEEDVEFFKEFCSHLSILLENARLYSEIKNRDLAKDTFLRSLSHELRNPLAPIKYALELLQLRNKDVSLDEDITVIDHQFDHMARLLNDLLDTNRFITGKIRLDKEPVEIGELIRDVAKAIEPIANAKDITMNFSYADTPVSLVADRTRLEQAVTNLLNNAVKFSSKGSVVSLTLSREKENVLIKVKDTGKGITPEEISHVFEPYYQSERLRNGNSGLGVGLRLVYEIMRLHGGKAEVMSAGADKGSEFILTLPLITSDVVRTKETSSLPSVKNSGKILVVDDNKAAADSLVRLLNALGWEAYGIYAPQDVPDYLAKNPVGLVFLDIGMPEIDGYMLVKMLREEGHKELPVIAVTGYGMEEDRDKAMQAGFTAHLTKPIGTRELHQVLEKISF